MHTHKNLNFKLSEIMNIRITIYSVFFVVLISSASFGAWKHVNENGSENTLRLKLWSNFEQRYTLISGQGAVMTCQQQNLDEHTVNSITIWAERMPHLVFWGPSSPIV